MKRPMFFRPGLVLLGALCWPQQTAAQEILYVDNIATCEGRIPCYTTIMDAVKAAAELDTIEVFPGIYREAVSLSSKSNLVLRAHKNALKPVIVHGVTIEQSPGVQVMNFVLEGGVFGYGGGSIVIQGNLTESIYFLSCTSCTVSKNTIVGGILFQSGYSSLIEGNTVMNGGIAISLADGRVYYNVIRNNVLRGGGITLVGGTVSGNTVELNRIDEGRIALSGGRSLSGNAIRRNVVRAGGIRLGGQTSSGNVVESNFVSGSTEDGIFVQATYSGSSGAFAIRANTSVENAGCDISDSSSPGIVNVWEENRFRTQCGAATG